VSVSDTSRPRPPGSASHAAVTLRPAELADSQNIWSWRNDEETRQASFDSSYIEFSDHERWFAASFRNPKRKIYVVIADGRDVGVVRLDVNERQAVVSIFLAPGCRGRGIGPEALRLVEARAAEELGLDGLIASVKPENYPSLSAFKAAGFAYLRTGPTVTLVKRLDGDR
jgi:RimJ/RimL family protein N-acetyltransferase